MFYICQWPSWTQTILITKDKCSTSYQIMDLINVANGCESNLLIPLSDCNCFITRLESQKFVGTVIIKHYIFFSLKDIELSKKIHEEKEVKENILKRKNLVWKSKKVLSAFSPYASSARNIDQIWGTSSKRCWWKICK